MQPSLFPCRADRRWQPLVADAEGGIRYLPGFFPAETAARWFVELRDAVPWKQVSRPMYDRVVDVPRLVFSTQLGADGLPGALREAAERVAASLQAPFNAVGLNFYRDGRDSVAPHNDTLHALAPGQAIALVSLGGTRDMVIAPKPGVPGRRLRVALEAGSLLVMSHASQHTHDHGVPKTRYPVEPRISIALRATQEGADLLRGHRARR
jgi:alkylated DNA repair dioxygenase AlkB